MAPTSPNQSREGLKVKAKPPVTSKRIRKPVRPEKGGG